MTASGSISFSSTMTRFIRLGTNIGDPTWGSEMWAMVTTMALVYPRGSARSPDRGPGPHRRVHRLPAGRAPAALHLHGAARGAHRGGGGGPAFGGAGPRPLHPVGDRARKLVRHRRERGRGRGARGVSGVARPPD